MPHRAEPGRPLLPGMRALLVVAGVLVLLAGVQLFVFPLRTAEWFAWTVSPPLTAVFLGAAYWSSAALEWAAATRRSWAQARIAVPGVFVFTTLTLVVTLVHLDRFHLGAEHAVATRAVTYAWIAIYVVVPVLMATLWWRQGRAPGADPPRRRPLPRAVRWALGLQGAVLLPLGLGLLLAPVSVSTVWPWDLTALTGRAVGAWLLSLGVVAVHALVERDVDRILPIVPGSLAFAVLQVVALARHGGDLHGGASTAVYVALLASFVVTGVGPLVGRSRPLAPAG